MLWAKRGTPRKTRRPRRWNVYSAFNRGGASDNKGWTKGSRGSTSSLWRKSIHLSGKPLEGPYSLKNVERSRLRNVGVSVRTGGRVTLASIVRPRCLCMRALPVSFIMRYKGALVGERPSGPVYHGCVSGGETARPRSCNRQEMIDRVSCKRDLVVSVCQWCPTNQITTSAVYNYTNEGTLTGRKSLWKSGHENVQQEGAQSTTSWYPFLATLE